MDNIDETLVRRLASFSPDTQRWLKTALQTVRTMPAPREDDPEEPLAHVVKQEAMPSPLEDVIAGKAKLDDQVEAYPELAEELEGIGDIIDMLRDIGESRRKRGRDILREEILGEPPEQSAEDEGPLF
jgi:hypothetical protein